MEKKKPIKNKSTKKKSINVKVDTKNVDVLEVDIDNDGIYDFVANGNAKFMEKGQVWKVTGKVLKMWLKSKFGKRK
jgi:hypothetical protein